MSVLLRPALPADKPTAARLFARYRAEIVGLGRTPAGADPYFDLYWSEADRWAYVIAHAAEPVGLILVNRWSPSGQGTDHSVAEFYVAPAYRGRGVGRQAARSAFQRHLGVWEVAASKTNLAAVGFWPSVVASASASETQILDGGDRWIWRFTSPGRRFDGAPAHTP